MKSLTGSNEEWFDGVVATLNLVLADECLIYTKTRNCNWQADDPQSKRLYEVIELQYDRLSGIIEEVADRIRAMGAQAMGTMSEFLQHARLREPMGKLPPAARMVAHLLEDHEAIIRALRSDLAMCAAEFNDVGTSGFLTRLVEQHERMASMLRAHLENS